MRSHRVSRPTPSPLAVLGLVVVSAFLAACGSGDVALPAPKQSAERPSSDSPGSGADPATGSDADSEYCQAVRELGSTADDLDDPAKAVETLAALGKVAPDELAGSFDVLAGIVGELSGLDEADPEAFGRAFEIVMDPTVQAAVQKIDATTLELCGISMDGATGGSSDGSSTTEDPAATDDTTDDGPGGTTGDIDLEHIDAIKEENSSSAWADKLVGTTVVNDTAVTVATSPGDDLTPADALEACEAIRLGLLPINAQVTVEVRNGDTLAASSPAGGRCANV